MSTEIELLYSLLHLTGYNISMDDLQNFRQWGSKTTGHPEYDPDLGIEATTGPLGQGIAMAVGMALAEAHLAARFNRDGYPVVDHFTFVLAGDGDLMEGISSEAASLAGTLQLGKLICLYDNNHVSLDATTDHVFTEDRVRHELSASRAAGSHIQCERSGMGLCSPAALQRPR